MADKIDDAEADGTKPYDVGYGRPPRDTRFQPGRSGNPRGRPKGARGLKAELRAELDERVTITVNGKQRRIPKRRLIIKVITGKAVKGDVKAADKLLSLIIQAEGFEGERPIARPLSDNDRLTLEQFFGGIDPAQTGSDEEGS